MGSRPLLPLAVSLVLALQVEPVRGDDARAEGPVLHLRVVRPLVAFGEEPELEVQALNRSGAAIVLAEPVEALPVRYWWEVKRLDGSPARAECGSGAGLCGVVDPVTAADFLVLAPGAQRPFSLDAYPGPVDWPSWGEPGEYRVRLRYEAGREHGRLDGGMEGDPQLCDLWARAVRGVIRSNWVEVTIEEPQPLHAMRLALFRQVRRGQSLAELRALLGPPDLDLPPTARAESDPSWRTRHERTWVYSLDPGARAGLGNPAEQDIGSHLEIRLDGRDRVGIALRRPLTFPRVYPEPVASLPEGTGYLAAFTPDGAWLVSAGRAGGALWRVAGLMEEPPAPTCTFPVEDAVAVAISPDGRWAAFCGDAGPQLWDLAEGRRGSAVCLPRLGQDERRDAAQAITSLPGGEELVTLAPEYGLPARLWRVDPVQRVVQPLSTLAVDLGDTAAWSADGRWVLTGHPEGFPLGASEADDALGSDRADDAAYDEVRLWSFSARPLAIQRIASAPQRPWGPRFDVTTVALSPDRRWALTGAFGGAVLWDLTPVERGEAPEPAALLPHPGEVSAVDFVRGGRALVSGVGRTKVWRLTLEGQGSAEEVATLKGDCSSHAASPDGRYVLTGEGIGGPPARLWRLDR